MIPKLAILETPIRRSGYNASFYNPHTLILKTISSTTNNQIDDVLEFNATLIHEWSHWIQHQGTSYGAFLHALKFTQEETTLTNLKDLPNFFIEELIEKRSKNKGSIIKLENQQFVAQDFNKYSNDINLFGQIWFDTQWISQFLNNHNIGRSAGVPSGQIFGDTISDVYLYYCDKKMQSEREIFEIREWYKFEDEDINFTKKITDLTPHTLMECAATIAELQFFIENTATILSPFIKSSHFENRKKVLMETSYGIPFRLFCEFLNTELSLNNLETLCSTLNILIYIALNPPVPPIQLEEPVNKSWSWFDIYPSWRFIRAVQTIKKIGLVKSKPNHNETINYIDKVCELSELPIISKNKFSIIKNFRDIDFSDSSVIFNKDKFSFNSYDYTHWVQNEFGKLRENSIHFLTNFGLCTTGQYSKDFINILIQDKNKMSFTKPPLEWTATNNIGCISQNNNFASTLICDVVSRYCLLDFVVGEGKFDLSAFPNEIDNNYFQELSNVFIRQNLIN